MSSDQKSAVAHTYSIDENWLALHCEPILDPELPIVDPHHHLWHRENVKYLLEHLLADISSGHRVIGTVCVDSHFMYSCDLPSEQAAIGEIEAVNGVAAFSSSGLYGNSRVCAGIVGRANLCEGARVETLLDQYQSRAPTRFRGIRHMAAWHQCAAVNMHQPPPPPHLLSDTNFCEGIRTLGKLNMSFDAWVYHTQLPQLIALIDSAPNTIFVVNHLGGVIGVGPYKDKRAQVFSDWNNSIRELARRPNVFMKLGGLGMRISGFGLQDLTRPASSEHLSELWKPYFEACIESFGTERAMFESNFPVDKGYTSYGVLWNAFKRIAQGYSSSEKANLFSKTAIRAYRLNLES